MSIEKLMKQINALKLRISQLDQFGYEDESTAMTKDLKVLEVELEAYERLAFEQAQLELAELLKEKEEKTKRTYRRRKKKVVEEDVDE